MGGCRRETRALSHGHEGMMAHESRTFGSGLSFVGQLMVYVLIGVRQTRTGDDGLPLSREYHDSHDKDSSLLPEVRSIRAVT